MSDDIVGRVHAVIWSGFEQQANKPGWAGAPLVVRDGDVEILDGAFDIRKVAQAVVAAFPELDEVHS